MKTVPTTDTDFTTIGGVHTSFTDQTDPYTLHGTISLAYTTNTPKDTGSSTGPSGIRTQNRNISRTINIHRRPTFCSDTPVCQVQPLLGMTHTENLQLWDRN